MKDLKDYSEDYFIEKIGITKEEYIDELYYYLREKNGKYYFCKNDELFALYNELIGRYLCNKISLETTSIEFTKKGLNKYEIITPNYRSNKHTYFKPEDNFEYGETVDTFNDWYFEDLDKKHQQDLLKLLAIDLMMEQEDRYARNLEEYYLDSTIRLAPIIDFSNAFSNHRNYTYFNPYLLIKKDVKSLDAFYEKYPAGYSYFKEIFNTDYLEIQKHLNEVYGLPIKGCKKSYISNTIKDNQKILTKLI